MPFCARKPDCSLAQRARFSAAALLFSCADAATLKLTRMASAAMNLVMKCPLRIWLRGFVVCRSGSVRALLVRQYFERRLVWLDAQRVIRHDADLLQRRLLQLAVRRLLARVLPERHAAFRHDRFGDRTGIVAELRHLRIVQADDD